MSELAFTVNGDAFEVPAAVTAWRVRRLKPRGAPELVYARDGRPLMLPIESDLDDLRDAVTMSGKYRLDPINDDGKCVEDVPAAYIHITKGERNADSSNDRGLEPRADVANAGLAQAVIEAVKLNAEALRQNAEISMRAVDRLPQLMEAMTAMLNVAAGTQLYALQQREVTPALRNRADDEYDEDQGDDDELDDDDGGSPLPGGSPFPIAGFDLNKAAGHMAAECMTKMMDRLGAMFGGSAKPTLAAASERQPASVDGHHDREHLVGQQPVAMRAAAAPAGPPPTQVRVQAQPASAHVQAPRPETPQPTSVIAAARLPDSPATLIVPTSTSVGIPEDQASMMHFFAVRNALSPAEQSEAITLIQEFTDEERAQWLHQLRTLSIPDAIATVRETLVQLAEARRKDRLTPPAPQSNRPS
jgi:hypothetical protein